MDDRQFTWPGWKEEGLDKDIDTLWTFDFMEYRIREGSGFTIDDVMKRMNDKNPEVGPALYEDGSVHLLLFHAHDETEEMVPEYYKIILGDLIEKGVQFIEPEFI